MDQRAREILANFDGIWIHEECRSAPVTRRIQELATGEKIHWVHEDPWKGHRGQMSAQAYDRSKKQLYVHNFQGQFFKRCPGSSQSKALTCCNYHILNLGQQCNMNCSYCYLQSYLNSPALHVYANLDQALDELREMSLAHAGSSLRVGTGEVIDSLSLDPVTDYGRKLIEFFRQFPKWRLELKTKSCFVDHLLSAPHAGNVILGFSINCRKVVESEEHGTATLEQRLAAARKGLDAGLKVQFHLDPLVHFDGWREAYEELVTQLADAFRPEEIDLISLGALRFQPEQRALMRERFGMRSLVTRSEMFASEGEKLRYDRPLRTEMFRFVQGEFAKRSRAWKTYLCMETPESWISTFGELPTRMPHLEESFRPIAMGRT